MKTSRIKHSPPRIGTTEYTGHIVGRNKTIVNPDDIQKLAEIGCTNKDIAYYFGINEDTLAYNFQDALIIGREDFKNKLRKAMFLNATERMIPSIQIFLAKNYLGMRDVPLAENEDSNKPLPWNDDF